jgi:TctA family transporter
MNTFAPIFYFFAKKRYPIVLLIIGLFLCLTITDKDLCKRLIVSRISLILVLTRSDALMSQLIFLWIIFNPYHYFLTFKNHQTLSLFLYSLPPKQLHWGRFQKVDNHSECNPNLATLIQ